MRRGRRGGMSAAEAVRRNREVFLRLTGEKGGAEASVPKPENRGEGETARPAPLYRGTEPRRPREIPRPEYREAGQEHGEAAAEPAGEPVEETARAIGYPAPGEGEAPPQKDPVKDFVYRLEREERLYPQGMSEPV